MVYNKFSITQFISAWFDNDRSLMDEETFQQCKTEYIDTADLYNNEDFEKTAYIYFIQNRINSIGVFISVQRSFIKDFNEPCQEYFYFIKKFGHNLKWSNNEEDFLQQLTNIENKEKKYDSILKKELVNLASKRKVQKKVDGEKDTTRESFLSALNLLGKLGYKFDEDKTTVERLALIIKQQKQEVDNLKNS